VYRRGGDGHEHPPEWHYYSNDPAPYLLWLFGERALPDLNLMVPESDAILNCDHLIDKRWVPYFVSRKQTAYRRAERLFPESRIHVYVMAANGGGRPAEAVDESDYKNEVEKTRLHYENMKAKKDSSGQPVEEVAE
jgi:hypothetical protein